MVRKSLVVVTSFATVAALPLVCTARPFEIREYTAPHVGTKPPPTMDGIYSDEEWSEAGPWTDEFVGLENDAVRAYRGEEVPLNYRWRAIWDRDYLYIVFEGETYELAYNGDPAYLEEDDGVYSFSVGVCQNLEVFFEPNWQDGDGFNSDAPDFTDPGGATINDGYHIVWFILEGDVDAPANEGVRGADNIDGPPFFFTAAAYNSTYLSGDWNPTFDPEYAATWNAKPMLGGTSLNRVENPGPTDPVARPLMEIGIPFSQLNPEWWVAEEGDPGETNLTLTPDANGEYVHVNDEWLIQMAAYTDPLQDATLIVWNHNLGSPFASYPRGKLIFGPAVTGIREWMLR